MKLKKHIIIPLCIAVYFVVLAYIGRDEWLVEGNAFSYWGKIVAEVVILILLSWAIRRRDRFRRQRGED